MTNAQPKDEFEPDPKYQSGLKKQCPLCASLNVRFFFSSRVFDIKGWTLECLDPDCQGFCVIPGEEDDLAAKHKAEIAFAISRPPKGEEWRDYEFN